jgi:FkbM family methyltransferase
MFRSIKAFVQARPRLYDVIKPLDPRRDPGRAFFRSYCRTHPASTTFLQVGANDGLLHDPIRECVVRYPWRGILVEPLPDVFERLRANYRHVADGRLEFVNAAVTSEDGRNLDFWTFRPEFLETLPRCERLFLLQKSSFDRDHLVRALPPGADPTSALTRIQVPGFTLRTLLEERWRGPPIDLLEIDAEGHEPAIFQGLDFDRWTPPTIYFESHNLRSRSSEVRELLTSRGYRVVNIGGDSAAILDPAVAGKRRGVP